MEVNPDMGWIDYPSTFFFFFLPGEMDRTLSRIINLVSFDKRREIFFHELGFRVPKVECKIFSSLPAKLLFHNKK